MVCACCYRFKLSAILQSFGRGCRGRVRREATHNAGADYADHLSKIDQAYCQQGQKGFGMQMGSRLIGSVAAVFELRE